MLRFALKTEILFFKVHLKRAAVHPVKMVEPVLMLTSTPLFVSAEMGTLEAIVNKVSRMKYHIQNYRNIIMVL